MSLVTKRWVLDREPQWLQLESLLQRAESPRASLRASLAPDEVRELGLLYRMVLVDLSRIRSSEGHQYLEPYLNGLTLRCHNQVYAAPPVRWGNIRSFFRVDFPQAFRRKQKFILAAFLMFLVGTVLALLTLYFHPEMEGAFLPEPLIEHVKQGQLWMDPMTAAPSESSFLMSNNIRVAFNAYVGGLLFGLGTLITMLFNGLYAFGGPLGVCFLHGMGWKLLNFIYAHGVIELTTIFIAGGAGMAIGTALIFPGNLPRWTAVRQNARESLVLIMGCVPLLVIAGCIEGMISLNHAVPTVVRLTIAGLSAVLLIVYFGFSGRDQIQSS